MKDRTIRILISKPGLDGHDRGAKVVAHALMNAGFEVIYTGLHQTVEQIVSVAVDEDVDVIGLSILSGAHIPISEKLMKILSEENATDILVIVGGNIPKKDFKTLKEIGISGIFQTGSNFEDIVKFIKKEVGGEG
jgi:methylmalonyl-CoA mutase C-terminal domain/subunit